MAVRPGFEPGSRGLEPRSLPLAHRTAVMVSKWLRRQESNLDRRVNNPPLCLRATAEWSGHVDSNHGPPASKAGALVQAEPYPGLSGFCKETSDPGLEPGPPVRQTGVVALPPVARSYAGSPARIRTWISRFRASQLRRWHTGLWMSKNNWFRRQGSNLDLRVKSPLLCHSSSGGSVPFRKSEHVDSNHGPLASEASALTRLRYTPIVLSNK